MYVRSMTAMAVLLFASAAHAGVADDLIAAIDKCAAMPDTNMRHDCYDRLPAIVKSLTAETTARIPMAPSVPAAAPAAHPTPVASPTPAAPQAPVATAQPESKSFLSRLFGSDDEPLPTDIISATVASYTFDYGLFVVTLDNGQVWRQVTAQNALIPFSKDRKNQVRIWRNSRGEFVLRIDDTLSLYHVRRIK
jgi:hypothetical protein